VLAFGVNGHHNRERIVGNIINGSSDGDLLQGTSGDDTITAGAGADAINLPTRQRQ
jgi:Ca2+-binding RTX toxin-like protein